MISYFSQNTFVKLILRKQSEAETPQNNIHSTQPPFFFEKKKNF